jgi:hypothetical protein
MNPQSKNAILSSFDRMVPDARLSDLRLAFGRDA